MTDIAARALSVFPAGISNGEYGLPEDRLVVIERGEGSRLWDTDGREFLDFSMGWGSCLVGHARPEVVEAVRAQAGRGCNFAYLNPHALEVGDGLVRLGLVPGRVPHLLQRAQPDLELRVGSEPVVAEQGDEIEVQVARVHQGQIVADVEGGVGQVGVEHSQASALEEPGVWQVCGCFSFDFGKSAADEIDVGFAHTRAAVGFYVPLPVWVLCLNCNARVRRSQVQQWLETRNAFVLEATAELAPDGDADLLLDDLAGFEVPHCIQCGGVLKPDVVFFGDAVPRPRVDKAYDQVAAADALLVVESSLMVFSSYRFCKRARELGKPMVAVNRGHTRADDWLEFKVDDECGRVLSRLITQPS